MKACGACGQELPKEKFSKKQWQLKQQRRCIDCIDANKEIQVNNAPPLPEKVQPAASSKSKRSSRKSQALSFPGMETREQMLDRTLGYKHLSSHEKKYLTWSDEGDQAIAVTRTKNKKKSVWWIESFTNDMQPDSKVGFSAPKDKGADVQFNFNPDYDRNAAEYPVISQLVLPDAGFLTREVKTCVDEVSCAEKTVFLKFMEGSNNIRVHCSKFTGVPSGHSIHGSYFKCEVELLGGDGWAWDGNNIVDEDTQSFSFFVSEDGASTVMSFSGSLSTNCLQKHHKELGMLLAYDCLTRVVLNTAELDEGVAREELMNAMSLSLNGLYVGEKRWTHVAGLFAFLVEEAIKNKCSLTRTTLLEIKLGEALEHCGDHSQAAAMYDEAGKHLHDAHHPKAATVYHKVAVAWKRHGDYEKAEGYYAVALQSLRFEHNYIVYRESAFNILTSLLSMYEDNVKNIAPLKLVRTLRALLIGAGADLPNQTSSNNSNAVLLSEYSNANGAKMRSTIQFIIIQSTSVQAMRAAIESFAHCDAQCSEGSEDEVPTNEIMALLENCTLPAESEGISEMIDDEDLFKQPPPNEECPICFDPMPHGSGSNYQACCGKMLCDGCIWAVATTSGDDLTLCPFCRTPGPCSDKESLRRVRKRAGVNDAYAFYKLGCFYNAGTYGLPQSYTRGTEHWVKAAELGSNDARCGLAHMYFLGEFGAEQDVQKAFEYWGHAAVAGNVMARHGLGYAEGKKGNVNRAFKHFMIAAKAGHEESLLKLRQGISGGCVRRDEYANALRAYQVSRDAMSTKQREKARKEMYVNGRKGRIIET